jgi:hypothetical protein
MALDRDFSDVFGLGPCKPRGVAYDPGIRWRGCGSAVLCESGNTDAAGTLGLRAG